MKRFSHWSNWLPRAMLVAVLLLGIQYQLGKSLRSQIVAWGEAVLGSQVELGHAQVSPIARQIVLNNLSASDPRNPWRNLAEAGRCEFDIAAGPIFQKRLVIESGSISGLKFATPRSLPAAAGSQRSVQVARSIQWWNDETNRQTEEWLEQLDRLFGPEMIRQFESVKRTADLSDRVPDRTAALDKRAKELTQRAAAFQRKVNAALVNPLRHAELLKTVAVEVPALQREFAELSHEIEQLPDEIDEERRTIVAARGNDEIWLQGQLRMPQLSRDAATTYLLQKQIGARLDELVGWLRYAREVVSATPTKAKPAWSRGEDIFFAGGRRQPGFLIREIALAGGGKIGDRPVELRGSLSDFASMPALHDRPMRLKLTSAGSQPIVIQATIDRTRAIVRDEFLVDIQGLILPQTELGDARGLHLVVAPSLAAVSISVTLEGERLVGDIQLVQKQVQIASIVGGDSSGKPMAKELNDSLGSIGALATRISLGGTLERPTCRLWSNLGPAVAEALDHALHVASEQHSRRLTKDSQREVDQKLAELDRQVAEAQAELDLRLSQTAAQLVALVAEHQPPGRITPEHVGRRLPANSLFR